MRLRAQKLLCVVVMLVAAALVVPAPVAGQSADGGWILPRTPDRASRPAGGLGQQ